jgi:Vanillate O-demethylase oxygenase C-terminal domain
MNKRSCIEHHHDLSAQLYVAAWSEEIAPDAKLARTEDKPMIELVQQRMAGWEFWDMRPLLLGGDEAAVRARRRLHSLIAAEASAAQSAPVSAAQAAVRTAASDPPSQGIL